MEWTPQPQVPFHARLFANGGKYDFWADDSGWFSIDTDCRRVLVPRGGDPIRREERLWGIPAILTFIARGEVPLHAAAIEVDGRAILLAAPRMSGKTTLAAAFVRAGYRLLSEDLSCIRVASQTPSVIPGPATLRLRRDVAKRLELPSLRVVAEHEDRVHFALPEGQRGDCQPVPLRAVALLKPSDDGVQLTRSDVFDAIRDLWVLSFRIPTDEDRTRSFRAITDIASSVPVWSVSRPLRFTDLMTAVERIASDV